MNQNSNYRKFLLLWAGELISSIGGGLTSFGLGVYVFHLTGSAASMALVTLFAYVPSLVLSAPAGVLADRYDRRLLMMAGDGLSALGLVYILFFMIRGEAGLREICTGVFLSSVFSSLLEPSYKATITDLLSREEYSKASGMVSLAGSARYLISPFLAGLLLSVSSIRLLLILDICTFFITVLCTAVVRSGMDTLPLPKRDSFLQSFREGWSAITERKGILILILVTSVMTFFMGTFQILAEPLILSFSDSRTLGIAESVCACGMLVSGVFLGIRGIQKNYVRILSISLMLSGGAMIGFGWREEIRMICAFGFLFFLLLPFANNCMEVLIRSNVEAEKQGRVWGLIGLLTQIGYLLAYVSAGFFADRLAFAYNVSVGRGAALVIRFSGSLLAVVALVLFVLREVRKLETAALSGN